MKKDDPSKQLFDSIVSQDKSYIDFAIENRTIENYYLDFKTTEQDDYSNKRTLYEADKKNYAKAISAFGNSEGGVLLWGVKTGAADADYAAAKKPIKNISNFASLLEGFTSLLTSPSHPNVSNKIIFENKEADQGYLITHIPKSSKRPFQVINDKDFRYYIRAGSTSSPASDVFIRSLFGVDPQPDVFMFFGIGPIEIDEGDVKMQVGLMLHNRGECVARNVNGYLHVGGRDLAIEVNQNTFNDFSYSKSSISGMKIGFVAKNGFLLGVEQEVQPLILHIKVAKPITENGIQVYGLVSADNQPGQRFETTVDRETLEKAYDECLRGKKESIQIAIFGDAKK